uniref:EGF-like domain-containing protein n=1 Tax=Steinernema glaseri TaxID=37863 RepID=A0A1I7YWD6_9BILA
MVRAIFFTYLGAEFVGKFGEKTNVNTEVECCEIAISQYKIGCRLRMEGEQMTCELLESFSGFKTSKGTEDTEPRDYLITTSNRCCEGDLTQKNGSLRDGLHLYQLLLVTDLLSGPCPSDMANCPLVKEIADYCSFVGSDIGSCISPKGLFLKDSECPAGQERVDLKKGKVLCCPVGEKFVKEVDGKAICCPPGKELKDGREGRAVCCEPDEKSDACCPTGTNYFSLLGTERCCEDGKTLVKSTSGAMGCCPKGENFMEIIGGVDFCCPDGKHFDRLEDGKTGCCEDGLVLKGFSSTNGMPFCCNSTDKFTQLLNLCCPEDAFAVQPKNASAYCLRANEHGKP